MIFFSVNPFIVKKVPIVRLKNGFRSKFCTGGTLLEAYFDKNK